jgi:SAM-dependent methyltransferase
VTCARLRPSPAPGDHRPAAERIAPLEAWHFWFVGRDRLVRNLLRRHRPPLPVLDVGCGTGRFAGLLASEGLPVVGLDREAGVRAPEARRLPIVAGDAERLPFAEGAAGTILARDVLEHLDDGRALAEWHRVLRPDGLLFLLVPAWPSLWSHRDEHAGHRRRYTRRTLRAAVEAAGFEVLELRGYGCTFLPALAVSRLLGRRRGARQLAAEEHLPAALNRCLTAVNGFEARLARTALPLPPTGSTLALVARRA